METIKKDLLIKIDSLRNAVENEDIDILIHLIDNRKSSMIMDFAKQIIQIRFGNIEQNLANSAKTCKDGQNTVVAIPKFRVGDVIRPKGSTTEYTIESISGGCYRGNLWRLPIGCDDDYELVEQKPADKVKPRLLTHERAMEISPFMRSGFENKDKVEPKFKVGDIITNGKIICKVDENNNNKYHGWFGYDKDLRVHYADIPDIENWHKWTIEDAKESDVIYSRHNTESFEWIGIFKSLDKENKRVFFYGFWHIMAESFSVCGNETYVLYDDFSPATKEQRELLFKKMTDAGYTFDFEKKELRKLKFRVGDIVKSKSQPMLDARKIISIGKDCYWCEDRGCIGFAWEDDRELVEPQPKQEWSEEDEKMFECALSMIEWYGGVDEDKSKPVSDWLKSLKDRYTWKPSDEQMSVIEAVINNKSFQRRHLDSLYNDLKKLKQL